MFRESHIQQKPHDISSFRNVNHVSSPVEGKNFVQLTEDLNSSYQIMETFRNVNDFAGKRD